jgi:hypothetical protein
MRGGECGNGGVAMARCGNTRVVPVWRGVARERCGKGAVWQARERCCNEGWVVWQEGQLSKVKARALWHTCSIYLLELRAPCKRDGRWRSLYSKRLCARGLFQLN